MSEALSAKKGVIKYSKKKQDEPASSDKLGVVGPNHDRTDESEEYHVYENYGKSVKYAEYIKQETTSTNSTKVVTVREIS